MAVSARTLFAAVGFNILLIVATAGCASTDTCSDGSCSIGSLSEPAAEIASARRPIEPAVPPSVLHADRESFERDVLQARGPVLVDFYADWCGPCQSLAPVLEELAVEAPHARVVKVNIDQSQELAGRYEVRSIPTLLVFRDGQVVQKVTGVRSKSQLHELLAPADGPRASSFALATDE